MPQPQEASPERDFVARTLLKHVEAMRRHVDGVRSAEDIESVHQMRVASRRLRNAMTVLKRHLPKGKRKGWRRRVRDVTSALGAARDADVQIEAVREIHDAVPAEIRERAHPGLERLLRHLGEHRDALQAPLRLVMDDLESCAVVGDLSETLAAMRSASGESAADDLRRRLGPEATKAITKQLREMRSYEKHIHEPDRVAELHEMRIAAKHLRYTLETYAPLFDEGLKGSIRIVKRIQTLLGDIHDADVWIDWLPRFVDAERERIATEDATPPFTEGIDYLLDDRGAQRDRLYAEFLTFYDKQAKADRWTELLTTVA